MNSLLDLSVVQLRRAAELKERIDDLNSELAAILRGEIPVPFDKGPKVKRTRKVSVVSAVMEALTKNDGVMDKAALLFAATEVKGAKINEGTFNATIQNLKNSGGIKSPGRGQFQIGKAAIAASSSTPADGGPKPKRKMSAAARAKVAAAAKARWAKVRAAKPGK